MKYEILIKHKDITRPQGYVMYSHYADSKKGLKIQLDYLINVMGYKLNDKDEYDNVQVSKKIRSNHYMILSSNEVLDEVN